MSILQSFWEIQKQQHVGVMLTHSYPQLDCRCEQRPRIDGGFLFTSTGQIKSNDIQTGAIKSVVYHLAAFL